MYDIIFNTEWLGYALDFDEILFVNVDIQYNVIEKNSVVLFTKCY